MGALTSMVGMLIQTGSGARPGGGAGAGATARGGVAHYAGQRRIGKNYARGIEDGQTLRRVFDQKPVSFFDLSPL